MVVKPFLVLACLCFAPLCPAFAQDLVYDFSHTTTCLQEKGADGRASDCWGAAADHCMEQSEGGYSTVGMVQCLDAEIKDWDRRLNAAYKLLSAGLKKDDAEMAELEAHVPSRFEALRDMQRAWITYRDTTCVYERSHWGNGTGGGPAALSCYLDLTARQAWSLEQDVSVYEYGACDGEGC